MLLCLLIYLLLVNVISRVKYTATNGRVVSVSCGRMLVGPVSRYFAGRCLQNPVSLKYGTGFFFTYLPCILILSKIFLFTYWCTSELSQKQF